MRLSDDGLTWIGLIVWLAVMLVLGIIAIALFAVPWWVVVAFPVCLFILMKVLPRMGF